MKKISYFIPLIVLAVLGAVFFLRLGEGGGNTLNNALAEKGVPEFPATTLAGYEGDQSAMDIISANDVTMVNYFASWCGPCRAEHPQLIAAAAQGVPVIGINYKDQDANATQFIEELGNPYKIIFTDGTGRTAIDWGVSGVPETFFVNSDSVVIDRIFGPITKDALAEKLATLTTPR